MHKRNVTRLYIAKQIFYSTTADCIVPKVKLAADRGVNEKRVRKTPKKGLQTSLLLLGPFMRITLNYVQMSQARLQFCSGIWTLDSPNRCRESLYFKQTLQTLLICYLLHVRQHAWSSY